MGVGTILSGVQGLGGPVVGGTRTAVGKTDFRWIFTMSRSRAKKIAWLVDGFLRPKSCRFWPQIFPRAHHTNPVPPAVLLAAASRPAPSSERTAAPNRSRTLIRGVMAVKRPCVLPVVCPGHGRPLAEVHYSAPTPDGIFLLSACLDKKPMLRNGDTGDWVGTFSGHKGAVWSAKLNLPATRAATGSADFSVKMWDAVTGTELYTWSHKHVVKTVDFSRDCASRKLLTAGQERLLRVFDLNNPVATPVHYKHPSNVRKALWSPESGGALHLYSGCDDGKLRLIDSRTQQGTAKSVQVGDEGAAVVDLELSRDETVLTVVAGKRVCFFDAATLNLLKSHELPRTLESASLHPQEIKSKRSFLAGGTDLWVRVFDYDTGEEKECYKGHHGPVHCLRYSPNGDSFASGSDDATIRIWIPQFR